MAILDATCTFSAVNPSKEHVQVVDITAGQWFWLMSTEGQSPLRPGVSPHVTLVAGQPVKFVAHSVDVNHGFGLKKGSTDSSILLQMQVIPKLDNVFYYTFKEPGTYFVICLEYCGYAHPLHDIYSHSCSCFLWRRTATGAGLANKESE